MPKYKTLIFDLDDTLINNDESIKYAFSVILKYLNIPFSEELFLKWEKFDTMYWHTWETGQMTLPPNLYGEAKVTYLRSNRFVQFFEHFNLNYIDAIKINEIYCDMLGHNIVEITGAKSLLSDLKNNNYELAIATNGPKSAAQNKLSKANISEYISFMVCAEDVGFSKPKKEFFDSLYQQTITKNKSEMLMIGDSLTTDVLFGMNNGIDTCWYNPNNIAIPEEYKPTIVINNLLELKKKI